MRPMQFSLKTLTPCPSQCASGFCVGLDQGGIWATSGGHGHPEYQVLEFLVLDDERPLP